MNQRKFYFAVIMIIASFNLSAIEKLKAPPAPFAATKIIKAMPQITVKNTIKTHGTRGTGSTDYSITCGDNKLQLRQNIPFMHYIYTGGRPESAAGINYWGSTEGGYGSPFKGKEYKIEKSTDGRYLIITKDFYTTKDKKDGVFTEKISVEKDGLIDFDYSYKVPAGVKVRDKGLFFSFRPFQNFAGMNLKIDGKDYKISEDAAPFGHKYVFKGKAKKVTLFANKPTRAFTLIFPENTRFYIKEKKKEADRKNRWKYYIEMRVHPDKNGHISFKLDMRNTSGESLKNNNTFNDINFWKNDRINIPDFAASKNLLPNPSFESGLRYYDNFFTWGKWPGKDYSIYNIDAENARSGKRCLRISAFKSYPSPNNLSSFTIPTKKGKKYTFSFYAKALGPKQRLSFTCVTADWGKFPKWKSFNLSEEWKRYSVTFTAPNTAAIVMFKVQNNGKNEKADTLVDDLQLEQNGKASDFVNRPFGSDLLSSDPDNFLAPGEKVNAKLRVFTNEKQSGKVKYKLKDFYYNVVCTGQKDFSTNDSGEAFIDLPLENIGTGIFILEAEYNLKNGKKYTDFYRITKMKLNNDNFKHRKLLACGAGVRTCRGEASVKRLRGLGFGSNNYQTTGLQNTLFEKYGIHNTGSGVVSYGPRGKDAIAKFRKETNKKIRAESYSADLAGDIEKLSYQMTKEYPWVKEWFLQGECNAGGGKFKVLKNRDDQSFVKFILACYDGVKRADPSKRFSLTGGPANMFKSGGISDIDRWLGVIEKMRPGLKFDSVNIHPYRTVPESPDLDDDAATLIKMLAKHGYQNIPIYWSEGIYHNPYQVSEWGLDPHKGCSTDHWRCGTPTYDMGWGERIAAAYYARSWLVGLKYADRVKSYNGWEGTTMSIDTRMTPLALQKIPNTLANLLGNADYKEDIRFAPKVRTYVFEDENKCPVAALWSYFPMVDRGYEPSPTAEITFKGLNAEFFDLMGNPVSVDIDKNGNAQIPAAPFPLFIKTQKGSLKQLCAALRNSRLQGSNEFALNVSMSLKNQNLATIAFQNRLSRNFVGTTEISYEPKPVKKELNLKKRESFDLDLKLFHPVSTAEIRKISVPVQVSEQGGSTVRKDLSLWCLASLKAKSTIVIDGKADDWKNIPAIKMNNIKMFASSGGTRSLPQQLKEYGGEKDFSAEYKLAWDQDYLYLYVNVVDDKAWFPAMKSVSGDWRKDSLQIYIDTLGDNGRRINKERFDFNDYNYDISMTGESGEVNVFRRAAPEQQIAGGLDAPKPNMVEPGVKVAIKKTGKGYVYEIAFPRLLIAPLELKENSFFRLGMIVNDNDGKGRKGGISNLPEKGMTPFENPENWLGVLLVK